MTTYIIPCSANKREHRSTARDLYVGQMFTNTLRAALTSASHDDNAQVLILSARYGLIELNAIVEPYDQRITDADAVTADTIAQQAIALDIGDDVYAMLPHAYFDVLDAALRTIDVYAHDVYETAAGIGEQRRINSLCAAHASPVGTRRPLVG